MTEEQPKINLPEKKWTDEDMLRCWCAGMMVDEEHNESFEQWFAGYQEKRGAEDALQA